MNKFANLYPQLIVPKTNDIVISICGEEVSGIIGVVRSSSNYFECLYNGSVVFLKLHKLKFKDFNTWEYS
jgi:hypothetical protein